MKFKWDRPEDILQWTSLVHASNPDYCISPIELVNEELILASGEYHMVSKDKDFRKKDSLSNNTVEGELEILLDLGLIDDDSLADVENSADNLTNQTAGDNTNNVQIQSSRESFPKISRKQDKVQAMRSASRSMH
ncbi:12735_t:CDS:2 [Funneliformis caledonium]|uniref:12735_t:CDS:1 n=1 Tax=Funneliformis caledonium TaxID=1117310 RepID=A0A9N8ZHY0_9GLOM|nr:12735_t:CDS:2 [Funneliformis caledonium]